MSSLKPAFFQKNEKTPNKYLICRSWKLKMDGAGVTGVSGGEKKQEA
jgi:hypothetical protein